MHWQQQAGLAAYLLTVATLTTAKPACECDRHLRNRTTVYSQHDIPWTTWPSHISGLSAFALLLTASLCGPQAVQSLLTFPLTKTLRMHVPRMACV